MLWVSVAICLFTLCQASSESCDAVSKPVDLAHSCLRVKGESAPNDDVPIILIHGLSSHKEFWKGIDEVLSLETGRRVCIVDLRNHGESPWSDEADTATMTKDIKHLMDKLDIPKAILLGHSLGGKITVHFAVTYPERAEKVIIEDMRPNSLSAEASRELRFGSNMFKDVNDLIPQGVSEREAKEIFLKDYNEFLKKHNSSSVYDDPEIFPITCSEGKCRWKTNTLLFRMLVDDIDSLIIKSTGRYDGPALFIYGKESIFQVGEDEREIKEMFPNAKLVGVKGAGHMVHVFPEFMTEVVKFINEK